MNVLRTLPDLFWAMLFATAVGFGPVAGALALSVFTIAVVSKLWSESLESIDMSLPEAVRVGRRHAGCRWCSSAPFRRGCSTTSPTCMYAFELNVRASMVLGLVGAGGIGMILEHPARQLRVRARDHDHPGRAGGRAGDRADQ
jgi:phosphonate transport system permease protein